MTHKPHQISSSRLRFHARPLVWKLYPCLFAKHSSGDEGSVWVPCVCMCACTHHFHRWGSTLPPEGCIETLFLLHEYQPLVIQVERAALSLGSPIVPGRHGCPLNQSERSAPTKQTWERKKGEEDPGEERKIQSLCLGHDILVGERNSRPWMAAKI